MTKHELPIKALLSDSFCESFGLDINKEHEIKKVKARSLINPQRIDLIAKLKYIEHRELNKDMSFIKKVYKKHIEAFSCGSYIESGNEEKNSIAKYFEVFDQLIKSIKNDGMDEKISVVPVGKDNVILNGAHRTAIAAFYDLKLPIVQCNNIEVKYDWIFFKERFLQDKYLDYLVKEYCNIKKKVGILYTINTKSTFATDNNYISDMDKGFSLIYRKNIKLNKLGLKYFLNLCNSSIYECENEVIEFHRNKLTLFENLEIYVLEDPEFNIIHEIVNKKNKTNKNGFTIFISDTQKALEIVNLTCDEYKIYQINKGISGKVIYIEKLIINCYMNLKIKCRNIIYKYKRNLVKVLKRLNYIDLIVKL